MSFASMGSSFGKMRLVSSVVALAVVAPGVAVDAGCAQVLGLSDFQEGGAASGGAGGTAAQSSASATSNVSASTSGPGSGGGPSCGDGKTQSPEQCDDGAENGAHKACKADCTQNVCGDGDLGPGEICDEGAKNGLGLLKCAPDCSRVIVKKKIVVSQTEMDSNLGSNPVAHADSLCPQGYKALFVFGDARRATTVATDVQNSVDWVISPYTYYYNSQANPIWLTDAVALLGVRKGAFVGLENPVQELVTQEVMTGLSADWTTLGTNNCNGWSKISSGTSKSVGYAFASDIAFITSADLSQCSGVAGFYCVEQ